MIMSLAKLSVLLSAVTLASGAEFRRGRRERGRGDVAAQEPYEPGLPGSGDFYCPTNYWQLANPRTMTDFDLDRFFGRWFLQHETPLTGITDDCKCTRMDVMPQFDPNRASELYYCERTSSVLDNNASLILNSVPGAPGALQLVTVPFPWWVIEHEDHEFALMYSCSEGFGPFLSGHALHYMSRTPTGFPQRLFDEWDARLRSNNVTYDVKPIAHDPACTYNGKPATGV